jgi:hypothetical protein
MPLPVAPIAGLALRYGLRYGTVALATYALLRRAERLPRSQRAEDALDQVDEGLALRRDPDQASAAARLKRGIRLGAGGPGIEVDLSALGRLRFRRI